MFGLIFLELYPFKNGYNENPDVEFPVITISYQYEGDASSNRKDVVSQLRVYLVSMQGIRNISSTASQ